MFFVEAASLKNPVALSVAYPVMEHFYTLQGEGAHTGRAAYFIRLGGCDVGCVWCDVKESWPVEGHPVMTVSEIVDVAASHAGRFAVITGGEPAMHDLTPLITGLHAAGFEVAIETSGTRLLTGGPDWVTLSPKKFKAPLPAVLAEAHELKVVIFHKSDFEWAEQHAAQVRESCRLYLQAEWSKREVITPLVLDYIARNPKWTLSLQTHKWLQIP